MKADRLTLGLFRTFTEHVLQEPIWLECYPEDHRRGDIDAVFNDLAIQHTSMDLLPDERRMNAQFGKFCEQVRRKSQFNWQRAVSVSVPYDLIEHGNDWGRLADALAGWLDRNATSINDGYYQTFEAPEFPAQFTVSAHEPKSKPPGLKFGRYLPETDSNAIGKLRNQIQGVPHDKIAPLRQYRNDGLRTALVLEAFGNSYKAFLQFAAAFPIGVAGLDEVWFINNLEQDWEIQNWLDGRCWFVSVEPMGLVRHDKSGPVLRWRQSSPGTGTV